MHVATTTTTPAAPAAGQGICPVCHGSMRRPCPDSLRPYCEKYGWHDYDQATDTVPCDNCGARGMGGKATGLVPLRKDGTPCLHEFSERKAGNCYYVYTCAHCPAQYDIDSGD